MRICDWSSDVCSSDLSFAPLGLESSTPGGLFGYSGGGMASSWAAEMAPTHAPELSIVGAVLGSPVGDPGEAFLKLNCGLNAGLPALVVSGLRHAYPGLARVIRQHANVDGQRRLDKLRRSEEHTSELQSLMRISYAAVC